MTVSSKMANKVSNKLVNIVKHLASYKRQIIPALVVGDQSRAKLKVSFGNLETRLQLNANVLHLVDVQQTTVC